MYTVWKYRDLQKECHRLGVKAHGKRTVLIERIISKLEATPEYAVPALIERVLATPEYPKTTEGMVTEVIRTEPINPNYNEDGTWRRRVKGWLGWAENGDPIYKE